MSPSELTHSGIGYTKLIEPGEDYRVISVYGNGASMVSVRCSRQDIGGVVVAKNGVDMRINPSDQTFHPEDNGILMAIIRRGETFTMPAIPLGQFTIRHFVRNPDQSEDIAS